MTLLDKYKDYANVDEMDLTHPQYAAMAIYQSCKHLKTKVNKSRLQGFSHLKSVQWANLERQWSNWLTNNVEVVDENIGCKTHESKLTYSITYIALNCINFTLQTF